MSDRFKRLSGLRPGAGGRGTRPGSAPRRTSRRQQEAMYQRLFYLGLIGAAVLIIAILAVGALYEYQIKPNQVLAKVNGYEIKRKDYWKYQSVVLFNQARTYESYALQVTGQQQTQFLSFAASFDQQRRDIWGSTDVSDITVQQMVEDRLYLQGAEEMGIDLSDAAAEQFALAMFAPSDQPLETPVPSPTLIPQRAEWATQTAEAMASQEALAMGTPDGSPAATPGATPVTNGATPVGTPGASPEATPDLAGARMSAQSAFVDFKESVFSDAHLTDEDYLELFVKPQLARDRVDTQIRNGVPQMAEQVNAEHILVATEDLANQIYEQVTSGASFEEVAKTSSTDASTAPTGGQLGWFTRDQMVAPFSDVAFSMEPGQISEPVQTEYGWHIIKVMDKSPDRALTTAQYTIATDRALSSWLDQQRDKADISSDYYRPTPPPTPEQFAPPSDAPTPIMATPVPPADVSATPIAGPVFTPSGTPAATPIATPIP